MSRTTNKNKEVRSVRTGDIFYEKSREQKFREKMARAAANGGDTNLRMELQTLIREEVNNGKNKEEILEKISQEEKFKRYEQFFDTWIEHHMTNYNKAIEGTLSGREIRNMYNTKRVDEEETR